MSTTPIIGLDPGIAPEPELQAAATRKRGGFLWQIIRKRPSNAISNYSRPSGVWTACFAAPSARGWSPARPISKC